MEKAVILSKTQFSEPYRNACFLEWYKSGKPSAVDFLLQIQSDERGAKPSIIALQKWIAAWKERAVNLDLEVEQGLVDSVVEEKVNMLNRHIETAKEIQSLSLDYLREHKEELTSNSAVRLLQLGIEIERNSVGIPEALKKMSSLDDETLLKEINAIIKDADITIEALEDAVEDGDNHS